LGNPLERDPAMVLNDVRNGYVTVKRAREVYRVVIETKDDDYVVNESQTRELRSHV
jgi:N-methylhydantoinase B/oxoprolinase/acetone carboxylase alpha subunit